MRKVCKNITIVFLISVCSLWGSVIFGQGSPSVITIQGESYLDGFDLKTLLGYEDVSIEGQEILSYLDEIEYELSSIEEEYIATGAIKGSYNTLDDCVQTAIKKHLPLIIATDKISLAKRKLIKAVRDLFPSFNLYYEHDVGWKLFKDDPDPTDAVDGSQRFRSEKIQYALSQPLFSGGTRLNQVKAERAQLNVSKTEYKKIFYDLTIEVARSYFNLMKAKTVRAYKNELQDVVAHMISVSSEKMDAGLISEIEHLNVQSLQSQIQHDYEAAKEDFELALVNFKKVLHLDLDEFVNIVPFDGAAINRIKLQINEQSRSDMVSEDEQAKKLDEFIKLAYQNRPEFKIQKYKVEAATWREKVAQGGWLPEVSFVGSLGRKAEAYKAFDNNPPWDDEHRIGIEVKWNFGGSTPQYVYDKHRQGVGVEATEVSIGADGYYDRKNIGGVSVLDGIDQFSKTKQAEIERKEALLELELSEKDIMSEVKESYYSYNRSLIQLKSIFKRLVYKEKLVQLARHRSEINEIQISEYIQAEIDRVRERESLYQAIVDHCLARASLNKAIGIRDYVSLEGF